MKTCKACGEEKPLTEYYTTNRGTSTLSFCKECWAIDQRYRYLQRKAVEASEAGSAEMNDHLLDELARIEQLYEARRAAGLKNPGDTHGTRNSVAESIDKQLAKFSS